VLSKSAPPTRPSYEHSGWTTYEGTVARILKVNYNFVWPAVIDLQPDEGTASTPPKPPLSIAEFNKKVKTLHFTNGADSDVVRGIYERTMRRALGGAKQLAYSSSAWDDADGVSFAASLPLCSRLERLKLGTNKLGDRGLAALAAGLAKVPQLKELNVEGNGFGDDGLVALVAALPGLPRLAQLSISNNRRIGAAGLRALGRAELPSVSNLQMSNSSFSEPSAFLDELQAGSLPSLRQLWIMFNEKMSVVDPLIRALNRGAMPKLELILAKDTLERQDVDVICKARPGLKVDIR